MKMLKKFGSGLLIFSFIIVMLACNTPMQAQAASDNGIKSCPSKIRIRTGYPWEYDSKTYDSEYNFYVEMKSPYYYVSSVKSSDKRNFRGEAVELYSDAKYRKEAYCRIAVYAYKEGTYKLTLTVKKNGDKKFKKTKTVTVYAYNESPFQYVKVNGKKKYENYYETQKSLKFEAKAAKGYKIKKIQVGKLNSESGYPEWKWTNLKNGGKFKLGTEKGRPRNSNVFGDFGWDTYEALSTPTAVKVTYRDKYTKQDEVEEFMFYYLNVE